MTGAAILPSTLLAFFVAGGVVFSGHQHSRLRQQRAFT